MNISDTTKSYVIDIETIPLPAEDRKYGAPTAETVKYGNIKDPVKRAEKLAQSIISWEAGTTCALKAEYGKIAMIGLQEVGKDEIEIFEGDGNEWQLLKEFWERIHGFTYTNMLIGHNLKSFDCPFIIRRSMINGIHNNAMRVVREATKAYNSDLIFDTMQAYACGDRQTMIKLEILAQALGIEVEPQEVTGKEFFKWWAKDKELCRKYLRNDIKMTKDVYKLMK